MKAQSFIIEFILFFLISFSIFSTISYFFVNQSTYLRRTVGGTNLDLINNFLTIHILKSANCNACKEVKVSEEIPSRVGGEYYKIELTKKGLNTTLLTTPFFNESSMVKLNETFDPSTSFNQTTSENKRIEIKINNTDKIIEVR